MNHIRLFIIILLAGIILSCTRESYHPLSLHPENPHYFLFRGKPVVLIGSTEHYGAVMNLDFDYIKYLDELAVSGLNVTRTFSGVYVEPSKAFGIEKNTMAPDRERYICPWARSNTPGYAVGGNKFDLDKWDENYFKRLKNFISEAGRRNIVVEIDLFSNYYDTIQWKLSPLYIANNINNIGNILDHKEINSLKHSDIIRYQEKMIQKMIYELKNFDNLYYEICNEPYYGDTLASCKWEKHLTSVVIDAEKEFNHKHLISNNIANNSLKLANPREGVSIYNFHYARPPEAVTINYQLNKVIGDNETGFDGIEDASYRNEAWNFMLAGGGLFNHLDYSFTTGNEDGTFIIGKDMPGGGGKTLRNQFLILAEFMKGIDFIHMAPLNLDSLKSPEPEKTTIRVLAKTDEEFAMYFLSKDSAGISSNIEIDLPAGSYTLTWVDTKTAGKTIVNLNNHPGGWTRITTPDYFNDIALRMVKLKF